MTSKVLDQTADKGRTKLAAFAQLYDFPEFVKQADINAVMQPDSHLPQNSYADYYNREFPCHTKAASWVSALYFHENKGNLNPKQATQIEQRLDKFAQYWGFKNAYDNLVKQHNEIHKEAELSDACYAYIWEGDNGVVEKRMPMRNPMEVKTAADWFHQYRDHWPFQDRKTIAQKIQKRANDLGVKLTTETDVFLEKQSGCGLCNPQEVVSAIRKRALLLDNNLWREGFNKLADFVQTAPALALGPDTLEKLAETLDQLDRSTGIARRYGPDIARPEDVLFSVSYKQASDFVEDSCTLTTGSIYDKTDFSKLARQDVQDVFGTDFADAVSTGLSVDAEKMAEFAATLPNTDAALLDQLMSASGIHPTHKQASLQKTGFDRSQLQKMASAN